MRKNIVDILLGHGADPEKCKLCDYGLEPVRYKGDDPEWIGTFVHPSIPAKDKLHICLPHSIKARRET